MDHSLKDRDIPDIVPVMTLPETVFFPQAVLPLHIFEPRYREMLRDVLEGDRVFAVAALDNTEAGDPVADEPPCSVATAGIIRSCQYHKDGTSDLLLQGICRIGMVECVAEHPYRLMEIRRLPSVPGADDATLSSLKRQLMGILKVRSRLGLPLPPELLTCFENVSEPDTLVDLVAYSLCPDARFRQSLLETLNTRQRFERMVRRMRREIREIHLARRLQGNLADEDIENN